MMWKRWLLCAENFGAVFVMVMMPEPSAEESGRSALLLGAVAREWIGGLTNVLGHLVVEHTSWLVCLFFVTDVLALGALWGPVRYAPGVLRLACHRC